MTNEIESLQAKAHRTMAEAQHLPCLLRHVSCSRGGAPLPRYYGSTHKGVHLMFGKHFVIEKRLPAHLGRDLTDAFEARQTADYGDMQSASSDAEEVLQKARSFVDHVERYLRERS